jgi:hypothetical protein
VLRSREVRLVVAPVGPALVDLELEEVVGGDVYLWWNAGLGHGRVWKSKKVSISLCGSRGCALLVGGALDVLPSNLLRHFFGKRHVTGQRSVHGCT